MAACGTPDLHAKKVFDIDLDTIKITALHAILPALIYISSANPVL